MDVRLVLATDRRLSFIRRAVLDAWARGGAASGTWTTSPRRTTGASSTWAREPGCSRPALGPRRSVS